MLTYYVPPTDTLKWSSMFGLMETAKKTLHIEDYSISQTSLEQVFLSFAQFQREETPDQRAQRITMDSRSPFVEQYKELTGYM